MNESYVQLVASQLRHFGLTDDVFDAEEVAADLVERASLNASLQELVDSADTLPGPTTFDPGWRQ